MTKILSTNFQRIGAGLRIAARTRVTLANQFPPNTVQRSSSTSSAPPNYFIEHTGLGACWGWTPTGEAVLTCESELPRAANEADREFLIDASEAFTAPTQGIVRLYARHVLPDVNATEKMPVVLYNDSLAIPPTEYRLSQLFDNGQFQLVFPGAKEFYADEGATFLVVEAPAAYAWTATAGKPLTITPSVLSIFSTTAGSTNTQWRICL